MPSLRQAFGQGGLVAVLALLGYLLVIAAVLIGPSVLVIAAALAAAAGLAAAYARHPEKVHSRARSFGHRLQTRALPALRGTAPNRSVPAKRATVTRLDRAPREEDGPGLAPGSPLIRLLLGRGWRDPAAMARDFVLIGAAGAALLLAGLALPDWPVIAWLAKVLSFLGLLTVLIASGVLYSAWQGRK